MKSVGDTATLRWKTWDPPCGPLVGDGLITSTGRRYLITKVSGRTLRCLVVPATAVIAGTWWQWRWNVRGRNA